MCQKIIGAAALFVSLLVAAQPEKLAQDAQQGDADAQVTLAFMLATGEGVLQNQVEAAKWYRKAAEQGGRLSKGTLTLSSI